VFVALNGGSTTLSSASEHPLLVRNYGHDAWRTERGLPQNSVNAIIQSRDGYLWLATFGGLARFDGLKFTIFDSVNIPGLMSNRVIAEYEDKRGRLWIGTEHAGLTCREAGRVTTFTIRDGLPSNFIHSIREDNEDNLWINTASGVALLSHGRIVPYPKLNDVPVQEFLFQAHDNSRWFRTQQGIARLHQRGVSVFATRAYAEFHARGYPNTYNSRFYEDKDGSVWFSTQDELVQFRDERFTTYLHYDVPNRKTAAWPRRVHEPVLAIGGDSLGNIYFLSRQGLSRLTRGQITQPQVIEGLAELIGRQPRLHSFLMDREDSIWIGTDGEGLHRFKLTPMIAYGKDEGLADRGFMAITEDRNGGVWFAGDQVFRDDSGRVTPFPSLSAVAAMHEDHNGDLWFGGYRGLQRLRDGHITTYRPENFDGGDLVASIYRDRNHTLWIGIGSPNGKGGLYQFQDGTWKRQEGLLFHDVRFITEEHSGALWIGGMEGLAHLQNGAFSHYGTAQGLSFNYVRAIYEDKDGALWIGTYGGGLNRLKNGRFVSITKNNGLFDNVVSRLMEDDDGNFWMSSNRGIFRTSRKELNDFADGKIESVTSVVYGTGDGMKTDECNGGGQPSGWKTRDGKLWFPTIKGVVTVDPRRMNTLPPPVVVEQLVRGGRALPVLEADRLPPGSGDLEFHYSGLSLVASEKVRFKYKLEGFDKDWVDAGTRRVAYYTNLSPGRYSFRVKASNNDGFWNEDDTSLRFYLLPHFYQTVWFRLLCTLPILVMGVTLYRFRIKHLRARQLDLESKVRERTYELQQQVIHSKRMAEDLKRTAAIVESSYDGIWSTDMEGNILTWNHGATNFFGHTPEEAVGKSVSMLLPADRAEELSRLLKKLKNGDCIHHFETIRLAKDGARREISLSLSPIRRDEKIVGVSAIARDIAQRRKAEEALRQAKEAAEAATRSKSEFLANMSHEIRTPLNGVVGMTELALETDLTPEQRDYLDTAHQSAGTLLAVVNDILDFSKIEAGKLHVESVRVDVHELLESAAKAFALRTHQKQLELVCNIPADVPQFIVGDPIRLRQVLFNLLSNAVKFTKQGEVILQVARGTGATGNELHFSVSDTGIGIAEDKQKLVFEAFSQADASTTRHYGGTGLGLAIAQRLVDLMRGRMWLDSRLERGTTFHFSIPLMHAKQTILETGTQRTTELKDLHMLVVDDNMTNRRTLEDMLHSWGIRCSSVETGKRALFLLSQAETADDPFHLVLLDSRMPNMDGFELAQRIRTRAGFCSAVIMMLTSEDCNASAARCCQIDVAAHVTKPVGRADLLAAIRGLIGVGTKPSAHQARPSPSIDPGFSQCLRVLLAEDNLVNQKLALRLLERNGHSVTVAQNGKEAVSLFQSHSFDVVLMDVQMPEMDGLEATVHIREQEGAGASRIPIIAMTAHAMKGDRERCLAAGMDGYLSKPINSKDLIATLHHHASALRA